MKRAALLCLAVLLVSGSLTAAKDLFVPSEYKTIQAAIDAASSGDTVIAADGIYAGEGNRDIDFKGKRITVMSKFGPQNCAIDCQGIDTEPHRGFYLHRGEDASSVIDGFTITGGWAYGGGAIKCVEASPTITNCIIKSNTAMSRGGGISCSGGSPTISDCTISSNSARWEGLGGGIYMDRCSGTISNCDVENNLSGGGVVLTSSPAVTIADCFVAGNSGGGIGSVRTDSKIRRCVIVNNKGAGLGVSSRSGEKTEIANCIISGNVADDTVAGIVCGGAVTIVNCLISGNLTGGGCSGIYGESRSSPTIINCTIVGNIGRKHDKGKGWCLPYSAEVISCIIRANAPNQQLHIGTEPPDPNAPTLRYCNIEGGWEGEGNISEDPLFVMDGPDAITGTWTEAAGYDSARNRTTLTDSNASFVQGELAGQLLQISTSHAKQAYITFNTATTIEVVSDQKGYGKVGNRYRLVDYHLRPGSACIDGGTIEGAPENDIEARHRRGLPDIGAYETEG